MSSNKKKDNGSSKPNKIIIIAATAVLTVSLVLLGYEVFENKRADSVNEELAGRHTEVNETVIITQPVSQTEETSAPAETAEETTPVTTEPPPLVQLDSMKSYLADNPHSAGWITVGGTSINNIVVQTDNNDFYLDHDFYGRRSQPGTVFADFRCVVNDYSFNQSDNIVIYGHNQANGSMFGTLQKYKVTKQNTSRFDFYLEHPTFTFSNLYEEYTYKIIAFFVCEVEPRQTRDGNVFDYHNYIRFGSNEYTFKQFSEQLNERTAVITGVDFEEGDKFLTLSTCSNEFEPSRFVVIGRRVRDGESIEVDTSLAKLNPDAKEPDWNFIYNN